MSFPAVSLICNVYCISYAFLNTSTQLSPFSPLLPPPPHTPVVQKRLKSLFYQWLLLIEAYSDDMWSCSTWKIFFLQDYVLCEIGSVPQCFILFFKESEPIWIGRSHMCLNAGPVRLLTRDPLFERIRDKNAVRRSWFFSSCCYGDDISPFLLFHFTHCRRTQQNKEVRSQIGRRFFSVKGDTKPDN